MTLTLNQVAEKYPYLNKRWIREMANEGLLPHSRPHYRLYMFDEEEFEKALMSIRPTTGADLDREVAKEYIRGKK